MYKRYIFQTLNSRLEEPRRYIQVLVGPRQTGKTTLAQQVLANLRTVTHSVSADEPIIHNRIWLAQQWDIARLKLQQKKEGASEAILVIDEIQKIPGWSEVVKRLWDEDTKNKLPLKVLLLGSAPLLMQKGLTESLAGRFEVIKTAHWSFEEMRDAFNWDLEQYIFFGGYPGSASLINDEQRWARYIIDSLIEPTISHDILLMTRVDKPALLRQLLHLGCEYSGQIISFHKMLGQLHDAGNTTTLAHYLELLAGAGMLTGLQKYSTKLIRQRASSPKLQILNTALMSATKKINFDMARKDRSLWGRLVESAVGAYISNSSFNQNIEAFYWRKNNMEVDFVIRQNTSITAIEVASGIKKNSLNGMSQFTKLYNPKRKLLVGGQGLPLKDFFLTPITDLLV